MQYLLQRRYIVADVNNICFFIVASSFPYLDSNEDIQNYYFEVERNFVSIASWIFLSVCLLIYIHRGLAYKNLSTKQEATE